MQSHGENSEATPGKLGEMVSEVRKYIFEVLFLLLKDEETSLWSLSIMRMLDFFQLMVFPFNSDANFPWRAGSLFTSIQSVIEVFRDNFLPLYFSLVYLPSRFFFGNFPCRFGYCGHYLCAFFDGKKKVYYHLACKGSY